MPAIDHGFKILAANSGQHLARAFGVATDAWRPLESTVQATTEQLADRVFLARRGDEAFVVHFECFAEWDDDAVWTLPPKAALLSRRERLPTVLIVLVLQPRGYRPRGGEFRQEALGEVTLLARFREVCAWQLTPEPWWEEHPGLMTLLPLCRPAESAEASIRQAVRVIESRKMAREERADLLTILGIFGKMQVPHADVLRIIGREKMKESPLYYEILEEGKLEGRQESVLTLIEKRFGAPAVEKLSPTIGKIDDPNRLDRLLRAILDCKDLAEFRKALREGKPRA